ncbi:putative ribonuclease H-like domain-containing protein [Tanacetum coccineum]
MDEAKTAKKIDWNDPLVIRYHTQKMKPKTVAQARRNMIKYLKNQGNFKISDFKGMSYNDIRPIFEKVWDFNQNIEPMDAEHGSEKQKSPTKEKSPEKVVEEEIDTQEELKESVKEPGAKRKKYIPRKSTRKRQKLEEDSEKEELKGLLDIIPREEVPIEVESISTKFPIVDWKTYVLTETFIYYQVFRGDGNSKNYKILSEMLEDFDRQDVEELYRLVKERYSTSRPEGFDLMLWGDLHTLFEPDEDDEIWKDQHEYKLLSWRLYDFSGIHILLMENGLAIHMLTERKYPLSQEMLTKMLSRKLEVDHESSQAFELLSKSNTNKVKSGFTGAYSTCTPSTSSTNIPEKEVLAGFADEVIYSLFAKQSEDWGGGVIAMIAIRMKKFYKKTGRRVRVDGKTHVGFDKKKLECFNCHNTGHFARECTTKGTHDGKKRRDSFYQHQEAGKQEKNQMGLLTMDDGIVNWGEHTEDEETNHALMAISSSSEANEIYEKDEKLKKYRRIGIKAVKEKEQLQKTLDSWKDSSTNLWRLINSDMSSNSKVGLGYEIQSNNEVLSYEEEMIFSVFNCSEEDSVRKPLYSRFIKTNDHKGVPHPLSGDYTPTPQEEIDESLYVYGKKGPQPAEPQLQLNGGRPNANSVRPNVNTGRVNVNSVRSNVNTGRTNVNPVRPTVNTGSSNVNTVRSRQPVPTKTSNSFSPKRPQGPQGRPKLVKPGSLRECNKDQLEDFEEFNGGSVTFGELGHFNLFSISQICDKQHKVLFTETECLVVSSDFKMPDENQILLKVPRHHNMYSFDMKTPTPAKGFACLIAKATSDESKLWHRRLGHINFKNLNKLVKGNLVRGLPSKVFRHSYSMLLRIRDEDVELIVVPSTVKNTEEKAESRKSSTNSKKEGYY